jgi:hypothetical protein
MASKELVGADHIPDLDEGYVALGDELVHVVDTNGNSRRMTLAAAVAAGGGGGGGGGLTAEDVRDTIGAALVAGTDMKIVVSDAGDTITLIGLQEWAPNLTDDAVCYIPAIAAMTIGQGNAMIGSATRTIEKSTAAAPDTFAATALPAALEAGAWLKLTYADVVGFAADHLVRTA